MLKLLLALGDAAMHAHDLLINEGHKRHVIEAIVERLPERKFVPTLDLIKEPINPGNCMTLVVAAQHDDLFRETHFKCEK